MAARAEVVICGAGIAGAAAAYHLAVVHGVRDIVLVDERAPLSLTSDKSTEAYRNWWPAPDDAMVRFMNRSIDGLESIAAATGNRIRLNRRGYVYASADPARAASWLEVGRRTAALGAGPLRVHRGQAGDPTYRSADPDAWEDQPTGADLLLDAGLVRRHFPYLAPRTLAVLHARRCGWFSGQQLGMWYLEEALARGVRCERGRVAGVDTRGGRVRGVTLEVAGVASRLDTERFVVASGPLVGETSRLLGVELPVFCELHRKVAFPDRLAAVPRDAPLVIWDDPQKLSWSDEERAALAAAAEPHGLLRAFPAGAHLRPEGGSEAATLLLLWAYDVEPVAPRFPLPAAPDFPEIVLRGLATMVPGLAPYLAKLPHTFVDGGYYTKTRENRPLVGPLPVDGAFVFGALSGYGLMASWAGGELLAAHATGAALPEYAAAFRLERYADPAYLELLSRWGDSAQL